MSFSVVVGTFGAEKWRRLAEERAVPSAEKQTHPAEVIHVHAKTLHDARNEGAAQAAGDHLVFLDADDELDPGYIEAMAGWLEAWEGNERYLVQPRTLGVVNGVEDAEAVFIPPRPLREGNFMVIGTLIPKVLFNEVGGFSDWECYEDWELWVRCFLAGAWLDQCEGAIYRVHVRPGSRNYKSRQVQLRTYKAIKRLHFGS